MCTNAYISICEGMFTTRASLGNLNILTLRNLPSKRSPSSFTVLVAKLARFSHS